MQTVLNSAAHRWQLRLQDPNDRHQKLKVELTVLSADHPTGSCVADASCTAASSADVAAE
ncbi:MAG: hypothetical protein H0T95_14060 [Chthoniobacterales bacterium]|nr:hypothetical protein [Chthoniobacterales bacterium]